MFKFKRKTVNEAATINGKTVEELIDEIHKSFYTEVEVLRADAEEGEKHYLVVTAWGLEAEDELVVNQKFN